MNRRDPLFETHVRVANAIDLSDNPAHGVGANRSIHAENRLPHLLELGARNLRNDNEDSNGPKRVSSHLGSS